MNHRTTADDRERVRRGHSSRIDSERADRSLDKMRTGWTPDEIANAPRTLAERRERERAMHAGTSPDPDPTAAARLARELARDAVMPDALSAACPDHDAEPGVYCYRGARGVCASRLGGARRS